MTKTFWCGVVLISVLCEHVQATEIAAARAYAQELLTKTGRSDVGFREVQDLGHDEAFRVSKERGRLVVEHQAPAGAFYAAQAIAAGDYETGILEKPDFDIRGTTLCLMPSNYRATLSPTLHPWFYDKALMTRTLDVFAEARLNTIFLWAGHMFPYIVEMPKYPEASADVGPEQVKANQEQFRWFTDECAKRNIRVLLHFYNIHVSPPFAEKHKTRTAPTTPTPLLRDYVYYALSRYFEEFASVGLYACPGESIHSKYQLEWFRDVIFKAAKDSGKDPVIVVRDWTQNMDFRNSIKKLYEYAYSEQKHNDESVSSPCPDVRIMQMEGIAREHIVNFHLVSDIVPMRWGSPVFLQESIQHLKSLGFVGGVEFFGVSFWRWPYTLDKLAPYQKGYVPQGPKLLSVERDAMYYQAFGRYLWQSTRELKREREYWAAFLGRKFGSPEVGRLLYDWYVTSGPIGPGLLNLNANKVAGWWSSPMLHNQSVGQTLTYNKSLAETPYTLHRETGRAQQRFYPRPFDAFFFERYREAHGSPKPGRVPAMYKEFAPYKARLGIDDLEQRHVMPVSQYAKALEQDLPTDQALNPDKAAALLNALAKESLALAEKAVRQADASDMGDENREELQRFVTDSRMYVLATEALLEKERAAILRARMQISGDVELAKPFLKHMERSVAVYEELVDLTVGTYRYGNELKNHHWENQGIAEFRRDLQNQRKWLFGFLADKGVLLPEMTTRCEVQPNGGVRIEAEWMWGPWRVGTEKYAGFEGSGYASSLYALAEADPAPMMARIEMPRAGRFTVAVRALKGGAHQDRALAVEVAGKRLKTTHEGEGPAAGAYGWEDAGVVDLPTGWTTITLHPVGKGHPTADAVELRPTGD